jgi:hypothetical protein
MYFGIPTGITTLRGEIKPRTLKAKKEYNLKGLGTRETE